MLCTKWSSFEVDYRALKVSSAVCRSRLHDTEALGPKMNCLDVDFPFGWVRRLYHSVNEMTGR